MKKLTAEAIKKRLEEANGPERLASDNTIDKLALLEVAAKLFMEEGIGSALLVRLMKSRQYMLRLTANEDFLAAVRRETGSDSPKLRRNAARMLGQVSREEADVLLLIDMLAKEDTRFVIPTILLSIGSIGGERAQAFLDAYTPTPPADETESKHYENEIEALKLARVTAMKHEKHVFKGLDKKYEIELVTPDRLSEQLKEELDDIGIEAYDVRMGSLKVKTDDYEGLFCARCFSEALFTAAIGISMKPKVVAEKARAFMLDLMRSTHEGEPPYRYRIEVNGEVENRTEYKKQLRDLIDNESIVNSPSDYELELRIEANNNASRVYVKLMTVKDKRFAYRLESIPASMNPATAAAVLRLASEYLTVNARVIDPCCGSGTMLFERGLISPCDSLTGVDIAHKAIDVARRNSEAAARMGIKQAKFICNDILRFESKRPYDELVCNLPFGNRVGTHSSCEALYSGLLDRLPQLVRSGGVAVLYTMEFTMLKRMIKERPNLEILKQERTEAGGLMPMIFILRVK